MSAGDDGVYVREIKIIKVPRSGSIPDKPIAFPSFDNLHLDLLENKKKLKKGLPLVPTTKRAPRPKPDVKPKPKDVKKKEKPPPEDKDMIRSLSGTEDDKTDSKIEDELGDDEEDDDEDVDEEEEDDEEDDGDIGQTVDDPYAGLTEEEIEKKKKEKYLWKFTTLKKKYKNPSIPIPDYNEHTDLYTLKSNYKKVYKEILLDDNVETYRTWLMGGFMAMEFVCTQWLGIDLTGFTPQQGKIMHKYNPLLIELGEREYNTWGSNLPVEVRLIGMVVIQAGLFYLGRVVASRFGTTVSDLFKGFTGQPPEPNPQKPPKKHMRGPKIKPDDIRRMSESDLD